MTHLMTIRAGVGVGSNAKWHAFTKMTSEHSVVNDLTEHAKIKIKEKNMSVRLRMTSVHAFASQSEEGDAFEIDLSGLNAQVTQLAALGLFHVKVMFVNTAEQRPQVNPFATMMAAKPASELPDAKDDSMYYHRISNVLLDRLRAKGLGYQKGDETGEKAITELLIAVPRALEYVLPFDDECGAFRLRACHIPAAFTTESLGVHRSENSHYVKRTDGAGVRPGDADQVLERPVRPHPHPRRRHVRRQPLLRRGNRRLPRRRRRAARARAAPPPRRGRGLSAREPRESPRANGTLRRARPRTLV